jgi:hypothetical protein
VTQQPPWTFSVHASALIRTRGLTPKDVLHVLAAPDPELSEQGAREGSDAALWIYCRDGCYVVADPIRRVIYTAWRKPQSPSRSVAWRKATEPELICPWCRATTEQLLPGDPLYDPRFPVQTRHRPEDLLVCPGPLLPEGTTEA